MLQPINAISTNQYYQKNNKVQKQPEVFNQTLELSGAESGRAILAQRNVSFRNIPKINAIEINLLEEPCEPFMELEIKHDVKESVKPEIFSLYSFAMNDQIIEDSKKLKDVSYSHVETYKNLNKLTFQCSEESFFKALNIINRSLIQGNINSRHIETAKKLAPTGLFLSRKTDEFQEEFKDISPEITEDQFEEIVNKIPNIEIKNFCNYIFETSKINVKLKMNKTFYNENKELIYKNLNDWGCFNEN